MQTKFPYLEITKHDRAIVGKKDPDTRIYRFSGVEEDPKTDSGAWFDGLSERFPDEQFVSPGGVAMFAPVSRAAVYKRINAGKLTAFCYHPTKRKRTLFGGLRKSRTTPYMYIPVSECKAWGEELKARVEPSDDPGWLPDKEFQEETGKVENWPKHKGKVSPPKWKRKKQAARKSSTGGFLSIF